MKIRFLVPMVFLLAAAPVWAQKVNVDFDHEYDFDKIETFGWFKSPETSVAQHDPLLHSRIVNAIEHYLGQGGISEADGDPDVYVTYHTSTKEELSLNTTSFGYGYPGAWGPYGGGYWGGGGFYGGGMASSSTTVSSYEVGTLVVDVWDRKSEKLVWRGTAGNMTVSPNPQKMMKKIDKALQKIVSKWQKIEAKAKG